MINQDFLKSILFYDQDTGLFNWLTKKSGRVNIGNIAGSPSRGYIQIGVNKKIYKAHRLAWLYVYGVWPEGEIDHINHDKSNNQISNLRVVRMAENMKNRPLLKNNKSGTTGVTFDNTGKKWRARINFSGKYIHLGLFGDLEDAIRARKKAEKEFKFHENHGI